MAEMEAWVMIPKLDKNKTGCVIDMHPLVLCKCCKYGIPTKNGAGESVVKCENPDAPWIDEIVLLPEWFCADGERKDIDGMH